MTCFGTQRRRWLSSLLAIAGVVLLAGCSVSVPRSAPSTDQSPPVASGAVPSTSAIPSNPFPTTTLAPKGAVYVPWILGKVDSQANRIYLSSSSASTDCKTPWRALVTETSTSITISVVAKSGQEPCTAEKKTLVGWVQLKGAIAARDIKHGPEA